MTNTNVDLFVPESLSLSDIFTNGDPIYQIPDYQRPYSWVDTQVEKLWEDLLESYMNNKTNDSIDSNYFLGSLIIVQKDTSEVVDGQQRLTTLMILLCVLRQTFPNINKNINAEKNSFVVKIGKIKNCIANSNELARLRLQVDVSQSSNASNLIFSEDIDFSTYEKPSNKELEVSVEKRYINTAFILYNHINEMGEEKIGDFINYIMNRVKLIKIKCYDESFAIKLFQTLNDRGMDLSSSDIIKGYLLYGIKKLENKHAYDTFMYDWRRCEELAKEVDESLTELFTYYEYYLLASNPKRSLVEEIKELIKGKDSNRFLSDFKEFIFKYEVIFNSTNKLLCCFRYLPWQTYWKTILITMEHTDYKEKLKLQKSLRDFFYLNYISGFTLNSLKQTFFNILVAVKEKQPVNKIEKIMSERLESKNVKDIVLKKLQSDEIYYEGWLKAVLAVLEYYQTDEEDVAYISLDYRDVNVEHIYPQNPDKNSLWLTMFPNGNDYLNSLGNLTLLSGTKNKSAQNFMFEEKINIYQGLDKNGKKTPTKRGDITVFQISQRIVIDYEKNTYNKKWNEQAVQGRFNWICEKFGDIFDVDTSSILY